MQFLWKYFFSQSRFMFVKVFQKYIHLKPKHLISFFCALFFHPISKTDSYHLFSLRLLRTVKEKKKTLPTRNTLLNTMQ